MIHLIKDKVAVTPIFDPDRTAGGLWIPEQAQERCDQGIIKYVGPEVKTLKIGQYVLFPNYVGTLMEIEDEGQLIIMREQYITAIIGDIPFTEVPGLYYIDRYGEAIPASYEQVFGIVSKAFTNAEFRKNFSAKDKQNETELEAHYYAHEEGD